MNYSTVRTALKSWVETLTGLPCFWSGSKEASYFKTSHCILFLSTPQTLGTDAVNREYDSGGGSGTEITPYQRGHRTFTLEVQVYSHRASSGYDAREYTSLIRDSIMLPEHAESFRAASVAFGSVLLETDLPTTEDNRVYSVAQIDLRFFGNSLVEGTKYGYIEKMTSASEFLLPDGTPAGGNFSGDIEW
jgi:hypothetical protein